MVCLCWKPKTPVLEKAWVILGWKALYYKIPGSIKKKTQPNSSENAIFQLCWLIIKNFLPRRLYDTGLVVSIYLDVLENVFFIAENRSPPSPSIGEKKQQKKNNKNFEVSFKVLDFLKFQFFIFLFKIDWILWILNKKLKKIFFKC